MKLGRIGEPGIELIVLIDVGEACAKVNEVEAVCKTVSETDEVGEVEEDEVPRLASELLELIPFATLIMSAAWKHIRKFHEDKEGSISLPSQQSHIR